MTHASFWQSNGATAIYHRGAGLADSRLLSPTSSFVVLPYLFRVLTSGWLAIICQMRWPWRFTLRSQFIATTFLAVVLGMIAWLDRAWIGK
jgi:hypothetical protein